jgi:hypothetical protein
MPADFDVRQFQLSLRQIHQRPEFRVFSFGLAHCCSKVSERGEILPFLFLSGGNQPEALPATLGRLWVAGLQT